jgi:hypothetical protein
MIYADLHVHTTASDGAFRPCDVVAKAKDAGLSCIAVTDHDSVSGVAEAVKRGKEIGVDVIPGIELSALDESNSREMHILGHFISIEDEALRKWLDEFISSRKERAVKMVAKLNALGYGIEIGRVREIAGGEFIGRPHIARALLERGCISDTKQAFTSDLIGKKGKAYVERKKISPREAITLIRCCGGTACLAHPGFLPDGTSLREEMILSLTKMGMQAIEVFYPMHSRGQEEACLAMARRYGLVPTGGSDFHGGNIFPEISIGCRGMREEDVIALRNAAGARIGHKAHPVTFRSRSTPQQ